MRKATKREPAGERTYRVASTWGTWKIIVGEGGVRMIALPSAPPRRESVFEWGIPPGCTAGDRRLIRSLMRQLSLYFLGKRKGIRISADPRGATAFRRRVWKRMRRIPYGGRISYGELARMIGSEKASRAVGSACAANPLPIVFPCHRVVGGRSPGGFSAGSRWKKFLLELESGRGVGNDARRSGVI